MGPYNIPNGRNRGKSSGSRRTKSQQTKTRRGKYKVHASRGNLESPILKTISMFIVFGIGVALAGMIALKLYLIPLPP